MKIYIIFILPLLFSGTAGCAGLETGAVSSLRKGGPKKTEWMIGPGRIGPLVPGRRIPSNLLRDSIYLRKNYFAAYIADGIIFEGFKLESPPLRVSLKSGPLHDRERTHSKAHSLSKRSRSRALRYARKGALIDMIVIESKRIKTAQGTGVGSRLVELKKAYPGLTLSPVPPTFGYDRCSAWTSELQDVYFYFKDCKKAEQGSRVIRILIFKH